MRRVLEGQAGRIIMCLAVPMEIKSIDDDMATCAVDGVSVRASISLVPDAKVGDWAIVHAGFAIQILDEAEARETLQLFEDIEAAYRDSVEEESR
jgi:hydrogenase expression/formation protein HypC